MLRLSMARGPETLILLCNNPQKNICTKNNGQQINFITLGFGPKPKFSAKDKHPFLMSRGEIEIYIKT